MGLPQVFVKFKRAVRKLINIQRRLKAQAARDQGSSFSGQMNDQSGLKLISSGSATFISLKDKADDKANTIKKIGSFCLA